MSQINSFKSLKDIESITGNAGGAVGPDAVNNINIVGDGVIITTTGTPLTNTITIGIAGSVATSYLTDDANSAIPALNVLTVAGGTNMGTTSAGSTVTVNLDDTITLSTVNATTFDTNVAAAGVTLSGITLSADGTDADIDINITAKGTGQVIIDDLNISGLTAGTVRSSATGDISSLADGADGTLLIGKTGDVPIWATLTDGNNITCTEGANSISIAVTGTTQYALQVGDATGSLDSLAVGATGETIMGSTGANPIWTGSPSFSGTVTAGTGVTVTTGDLTLTDGDAIITNKDVAITSPLVYFKKYRGAAALTTGDLIGTIKFSGYDGTQLTDGARITSTSSGTIASTRVASDLKFYTHPNSAAVNPTLRMTISSTGAVNIAAPDSGVGLTVGNFLSAVNSTDAFTYLGIGVAQVYGTGPYASGNTGIGYYSLSHIGYGYDYWRYNTAVGAYSGYSLGSDPGGTCDSHTLIGYKAGYLVGNNSFANTVVGFQAFNGATVRCKHNLVLGYNAGSSCTGSDKTSNIYLNSYGAAESNKLRIGKASGTGDGELNAAYIHGIYGVTPGATLNVALINSSGQLGSAATLSVAQGGTGASTLLDGGLLVGATTSPIEALSVGSTGTILTGVTGANPTWLATGTEGKVLTSHNGAALTWETPTVGTVTSVSGGTNISTSGTASDPVVDLDATITLTTVNATTFDTNVAAAGVTLAGTSLVADGTDANINLNITAKGTGQVIIDDLQLTTDLTVPYGGTGASTLTAYGLLTGNGTSAITAIDSAAATTGHILTAVNGSAPTFQAPAASGITWTAITANQTAAVDNGYICNKGTLLELALPTTCAVGKTVRVTGMNIALGWKVTQAANQIIHMGTSSTTTGATGYISSTEIRDSVELVCVVANLEFNVVSSFGNITIA